MVSIADRDLLGNKNVFAYRYVYLRADDHVMHDFGVIPDSQLSTGLNVDDRVASYIDTIPQMPAPVWGVPEVDAGVDK